MAFFGVKKNAQFAFGAKYRLWLSREWDAKLPKALFIMLNPSTADGLIDDPTARKCMGFARRWRHGGIFVVNLFDLRTPSPDVLMKAKEPCSVLNDSAIMGALIDAKESKGNIVLAWGNHGSHLHRDDEVLEHVWQRDVDVFSLGDLTKVGQHHNTRCTCLMTRL